MSARRRFRKGAAVLAAAGLLFGAAGCKVDGTPYRAGSSPDTGAVDLNQFEGALTECDILAPAQIAEAVGGGLTGGSFNGAICRWFVQGATLTDVTLAWFEWGDLNVEKTNAKRMGFETENLQVKSMAGFLQRDPDKPQFCGVTAKSPGRGVLTWWVEPVSGGSGCESAIALMELVLDSAG